MEAVYTQIGIWGHAGAAFLFAALAVWQLHRRLYENASQKTLLAAYAITAFWALTVAVEGPNATIGKLAETLRNFAWLGFMFALLSSGEKRAETRMVKWIYAVLSLVLAAQIVCDVLVPALAGHATLVVVSSYTALLLRMLFAIGALVLIHNLYTVSAPQARWGIRLAMGSLAAIWTYDLNLYTITYLTRQTSVELLVMRGVVMALIAPVMGMASLRNTKWQLQLSRSVTFRSLSLVAIGSYLVAMVVITSLLQVIGGDYARLVQISVLSAMTVGALLLLPSGRFRSWLRVKIAKNFFQHRYDYRSEWIRFTDTIGRPEDDQAPFHSRVIQAVADITDSPAGLLLVPDASGELSVAARWNWSQVDVPAPACDSACAGFFETTQHIVEFDSLRTGSDPRCSISQMPEWMLREESTWAAVPLVHFERLRGVILLARPRVYRTLDWEDLDMLRVVGRQVASYLAEAQSQEALSESERFQEFNRRMAFIMHDIKNLVSQLTLLARNAQRHADNPEFRADMIETLQQSAAKMNSLLARLSQHNSARAEAPRPILLADLLQQVLRSNNRLHNLEYGQLDNILVLADPARVEQILGHLVQNAIDASPEGQPIRLQARLRDEHGVIEVIDKGIGMSSEFIQHQLFKPFVSNKPGGFGIGAYEARSLAQSMGGRLEVESQPDKGSRFSLILPLARSLGDAKTESLNAPQNIEKAA